MRVTQLALGGLGGECDGVEFCTPVGHVDKAAQATRKPNTNPLFPLVQAWQRARAVPIEPDSKPRGILPHTLRAAVVAQREALPVGEGSAVGALPELEWESSGIVPALPLEVLDRSGAPITTPGHGAPLGARVWYDAILAYDRKSRSDGGTVLLRTTLADVTDWLWGPGKWRPDRHLAPLRRALLEVDSFRVAYERREWRMVGVEALPTRDTALTDPLPFRIRLPFESDRGPLIDRVAMRALGRVSTTAWRAWIRLAYLWDAAAGRNNGLRIYAWRPAVKRDAQGVLLDADGRRIVGPDPSARSTGAPPNAQRQTRAQLAGRARCQTRTGRTDAGKNPRPRSHPGRCRLGTARFRRRAGDSRSMAQAP